MNAEIKLVCRYHTNNRLVRFKDTTDAYILKTEFPNIRVGGSDDNILYIDPSGGPMLYRDLLLEEANAYIKDILWLKGIGFILILKEKDDLSCNKSTSSI